MKLRFLKLMLLLFILPLQMLAAELGVAGKQLAALPGVSNVETLKSTHFPEKYVFFIKQQLDAKDASKGYFEQRVVLCHRGFDRPTVLVTEGYNANYALREGYIEELSKLFDTNIITVEYRYFDKSMPSPCNWDYLTVENSLYDLHHVNQTLHAMYKGKWIATGISKGGQTTMFYRSYFPDDVDISVPYVAPLNKGVEDGRHEKFLQYQVSTKENRQKVLDFQLLLFKRKAALLPMFEKYCNDKKYVFNAPLAEIFDYSVFEYAFAFWQWGEDINKIPAREADDKTVFDYWINMCEPEYFTNYNGSMMAIEKLLELGCRHPVYIRFHSIFPGESDKRKDGYLAACKKYHITPDFLDMEDCDNFIDIMKQFIDKHKKSDGSLSFDGVFCHTDYHGYLFKKLLQKEGYRVPEDVQLIGFDGIRKFGGSKEDLFVSSMCQPLPQLAAKCVEIITTEDRSMIPSLTLLPVTFEDGGTTRSLKKG